MTNRSGFDATNIRASIVGMAMNTSSTDESGGRREEICGKVAIFIGKTDATQRCQQQSMILCR
jgi:hypothetical protein